mmetsp:Transcript_1333/g.2759  ORF Transcript_1333/g.2759 Transcript_1333/m.2759 type:complete len:754 (+) Transcript_1333:646-2907(+)
MNTQIALVRAVGAMAVVQRARTVLENSANGARDSLMKLLARVMCTMFGTRVWKEHKHKGFWSFVAVLNVRAFEVGFAPQTVWRQILLAFWMQAVYLVSTKVWKVARHSVLCSSASRKLRAAMHAAKSYDEWKEAAEQLDVLQGSANWKAYAPSSVYDWKRLERKLAHFEELLRARATHAHPASRVEADNGLLFHLRAGLSRDQCGLGHPKLYDQTNVGTKRLVEHYVAQVANLLQLVVESPNLDNDAKLAFLNQTRHAYGRTALLLSGGATMGLFHLGIVKALQDQKLLPHIISGASAGSIVAAMVACKTEPEMENMFDPYAYEHFNMLGTVEELQGKVHPVWARMKNLFHKGVMFDTEVLKVFLREQVGDLTFQEAFNRTGRVLNITVQPSNPGQGSSRQPRLLNYLTSPHVLVWSAAVASCAIPGVFDPVELVAKNHTGAIVPHSHDGVKYADGSFGNDLPILRLKELFNVNLFIVSQANPISIAVGNCCLGQTDILSQAVRFLKNQATSFLRNLWHTEFLHWVPMLQVVIPTITQDMEGDITWMAPIGYGDITKLLDNPSAERVADIIARGERHAWPIISQIDTRCLIEFALDDCIQQVRGVMLRPGSFSALGSFGAAVHDVHDLRKHTHGRLGSMTSHLSSMSLAELDATCEGLEVDHASAAWTSQLSITKANHRRHSRGSDDHLFHSSLTSSPRSLSEDPIRNDYDPRLYVSRDKLVEFGTSQVSMPKPEDIIGTATETSSIARSGTT